MKTLSIFALLSILLCFLTLSSNAAEKSTQTKKPSKKHREHKIHTHGTGTLDIAIEKNIIKVVLVLPSEDFVGFEGPPETAEQKTAYQKMATVMTNEYNIFLIDEAAGCEINKGKHTLDADHTEHGNYTFKMEYICSNISKVKTLDVNTFRDMESVNELKVQVVTDKTQKATKLNRTSTKVEL